MGGVGGAFVDPAFEGGDFGGSETGDFRVGRGHHFFVVVADDAEDEFTVGALAGDDHGGAVFRAEGAFLGVEAELGLAAFFVGAVAMVALVREDGLDVATEVDRRGRRPQRKDSEREENEGENASEGSERKHGAIG